MRRSRWKGDRSFRFCFMLYVIRVLLQMGEQLAFSKLCAMLCTTCYNLMMTVQIFPDLEPQRHYLSRGVGCEEHHGGRRRYIENELHSHSNTARPHAEISPCIRVLPLYVTQYQTVSFKSMTIKWARDCWAATLINQVVVNRHPDQNNRNQWCSRKLWSCCQCSGLPIIWPR